MSTHGRYAVCFCSLAGHKKKFKCPMKVLNRTFPCMMYRALGLSVHLCKAGSPAMGQISRCKRLRSSHCFGCAQCAVELNRTLLCTPKFFESRTFTTTHLGRDFLKFSENVEAQHHQWTSQWHSLRHQSIHIYSHSPCQFKIYPTTFRNSYIIITPDARCAFGYHNLFYETPTDLSHTL
jgi:hypothetical protein